jgi:hypothetical protein
MSIAAYLGKSTRERCRPAAERIGHRLREALDEQPDPAVGAPAILSGNRIGEPTAPEHYQTVAAYDPVLQSHCRLNLSPERPAAGNRPAGNRPAGNRNGSDV